jgi:putative addiction module killer protein
MLEATPQKIEEYVTEDGRSPFAEWIESLKDRAARARIRVRLDRLSLGNWGDSGSLGGSLHELRIDYGPGYRVYFGQAGRPILLLLCGGTKSTQARDIEQARAYWRDYRRRSS